MNTNKPTPTMNMLSASIVLFGIYLLTYNPFNLSSLYQALSLVLLITIFVTAFIKTLTGMVFLEFTRQTRIELIKVVWPTRPDIRQTTIIIFIAVVITSIFLWIVDSFFSYAVQVLTS